MWLRHVGDWSSGMIGVSKTFGGGSIPSSPGRKIAVSLDLRITAIFVTAVSVFSFQAYKALTIKSVYASHDNNHPFLLNIH